ncbi:MAG: hypothetical protein J5635_01950 [Paludibacteraceae bacterium]|nr:hypothetical protein [Paludibacteraceae bacterium]
MKRKVPCQSLSNSAAKLQIIFELCKLFGKKNFKKISKEKTLCSTEKCVFADYQYFRSQNWKTCPMKKFLQIVAKLERIVQTGSPFWQKLLIIRKGEKSRKVRG